MFTNCFFWLIQRALASRWATAHEESHSDFIDGQSAHLGPFYILVLRLRSLDCARASIDIRALPWPKRVFGRWLPGRRDIGFQACCGTDCMEQTGFHTYWWIDTQHPSLKTHLAARFSNFLFAQIPRWMASTWFREVKVQHTAWEESCTSRIGPICLESHNAFVLDHADVYFGLRLPTIHCSNGRWQRGHLHLGYRACRGEEQVRQTGLDVCWIRPLADKTGSQIAKGNDLPF